MNLGQYVPWFRGDSSSHNGHDSSPAKVLQGERIHPILYEYKDLAKDVEDHEQTQLDDAVLDKMEGYYYKQLDNAHLATLLFEKIPKKLDDLHVEFFDERIKALQNTLDAMNNKLTKKTAANYDKFCVGIQTVSDIKDIVLRQQEQFSQAKAKHNSLKEFYVFKVHSLIEKQKKLGRSKTILNMLVKVHSKIGSVLSSLKTTNAPSEKAESKELDPTTPHDSTPTRKISFDVQEFLDGKKRDPKRLSREVKRTSKTAAEIERDQQVYYQNLKECLFHILEYKKQEKQVHTELSSESPWISGMLASLSKSVHTGFENIKLQLENLLRKHLLGGEAKEVSRLTTFLESLEQEKLLEEGSVVDFIRGFYDFLCAEVVHQSLTEILEEKTNYLSITQRNIISSLIKEDRGKLIQKVKLLDGQNIMIFLTHFFKNFSLKREAIRKTMLEAKSNVEYSKIFDNQYQDTVEHLLFAFSEESVLKIDYEEFIFLDRFICHFLLSMDDGSSGLLLKWTQRSAKYCVRHTLNLFLDTIKSVSAQTYKTIHLEKTLAHILKEKEGLEYGGESFINSTYSPKELITKFESLTEKLNTLLINNLASENFHKFVEKTHKVSSFIIHLKFLKDELTEASKVRNISIEKEMKEQEVAAKTISSILQAMVYIYIKVSYELSTPSNTISLLGEKLAEVEKRNLWDRTGLFNYSSKVTLDSSILRINQWFNSNISESSQDTEFVSYLKHAFGVKVGELTSEKIDNKFILLEAFVMTLINLSRLENLTTILTNFDLLDGGVLPTVTSAVGAIKRIIGEKIVRDKLPHDQMIMCFVNRKYEEGKEKEYQTMLKTFLTDFKSKLGYMLKGGISTEDSEKLVRDISTSVLLFLVEVFQDVVTKMNFSNDSFDRVSEEYSTCKRILGAGAPVQEATAIDKLGDLKESLGDKNRLLLVLKDNLFKYTDLFMRKLSDKYLTAVEIEQLKEKAKLEAQKFVPLVAISRQASEG